MYTVGSVPFVNAKPLVAWFEHLGDASPVKVLYEVPPKLPALLESGAAQAIMVSSIEALSVSGRRFAEGVCIGSRGPAESVRLFSKVAFGHISSLALDQSSMTSNALAQIVLAEAFGAEPLADPKPPNLAAMLDKHDAAILIGDKGMMADGAGLHVLDLGSAWRDLTGLPFVWALWTGGRDLTQEVSGYLNAALEWGIEHLDQIVDRVIAESSWQHEMALRYLSQTMNYRLDAASLEGLQRFGELAERHGLIQKATAPEPVTPAKRAVPV